MREHRALAIVIVCLAVLGAASLCQAAPRVIERQATAAPTDTAEGARADLWRALWLLALTRTPVLMPEVEAPIETNGISDGPDPIGSTPDPPVGRNGSGSRSHGKGSGSTGGSAGDYRRPSSEGSPTFGLD
jgi:hypothetical protein